MCKKDIFVFAMILEGDIYEDGYGTTKEDKKMLRKALFKAYGADENTSKEELLKLQDDVDADARNFIQEYREKIKIFLESQ